VRQNRKPKLGDMLVVNPRSDQRVSLEGDEQYVGIVYEIRLDKWGHQNNVFVVWQGDIAPNYNRQHGYAGTNIHNLRSEFMVIRKGVNIP
jgi:hypothetical protein